MVQITSSICVCMLDMLYSYLVFENYVIKCSIKEFYNDEGELLNNDDI
jgi:hypothetical protein